MEPNAYRHCTLCPRGCGVDRTSGARGFCGASDVVYVGRAALHAWEEPPLSGERGLFHPLYLGVRILPEPDDQQTRSTGKTGDAGAFDRNFSGASDTGRT